jgi:hypothetical protein
MPKLDRRASVPPATSALATAGKKTPGSVTSVFGEPGDFQAALREDGVLGMMITGRG